MRAPIAVLTVAVLLSTSAQALDWEVDAALFVTERPRLEDSYVNATGYHSLVVKQVHILDYVTFPQARIDFGKMQPDGITYDSCSTSFTLLANRLVHDCLTKVIQDPCRDTLWQGRTQGTLKGHVESGTKTDLADPVNIVCCI